MCSSSIGIETYLKPIIFILFIISVVAIHVWIIYKYKRNKLG